MQTRPNMLRNDALVAMGPRRASTFPESMPTAQRTSLPLSQAHLANLGIDPAYNSPSQSGSDFFDAVPGLTPTSTTASSFGSYGLGSGSTPQQRPPQTFPPTPVGFPDPAGLNVPLTDISTMMFPSADPMAYPNQPMTTFEDSHPQTFGVKHDPTSGPRPPFQVSDIDMQPTPPAFSPGRMPNLPMGPRRSDTEVQLFGPMPMYLLQEAQQRGLQPQHNPQNVPVPSQETSNVNFDDLFGGEEWAQTFMDPGLGLSGSSAGFGNNPPYPTAGPGMGNWR